MVSTQKDYASSPVHTEKVSPSQLYEALMRLIPGGIPVMIWGPPGQGKSAIAQQVSEALNRKYSVIHAGIYDRVDLVGIPYVQNGRTYWAIPNVFPDSDDQTPAVINFEELTTAKQDVMSALMQLFLDHAYGTYKLPGAVSLIACGNRRQDRAATHAMPTPLSSRIVHFELETTLQDWNEWAVGANIDPDVIFFLKFNSDNFNQFNPDTFQQSGDYTYPCPRTWEQISKVKALMSAESDEIARKAYAGTVGKGAAAAFCAYLRMKQDLPDPHQVLAAPDDAIIPNDPSALTALCSSLYAISADPALWTPICTYAQRLNDDHPEHSVFLVGQCISRDPNLKATKPVLPMVVDNHRMTTPEDIWRLLTECRRNPSPGLLHQARVAFREARTLSPDDPQWKAVAQYGKNVAAIVEQPSQLNWIPTPDGLGLIAHINDDSDDYLVVHPQNTWWRAGTASFDGGQPTIWSPERLPSMEAAMRAASVITIPQN